MADVYVNRKTFEPLDDGYAQKSTNVDIYESIPSTTHEEPQPFNRPEYLALVNGLMNAANNRDFYSLNQMLAPLIEGKNIEFLDTVCALHWCCFSGHVDLVNRLLDVGCDPFLPDPINYESPVYYAVKSANAHIISILLKRFGPLILCHENRKSKTPFLVAVSEYTEEDIVAVLHLLEFLYLSGVSLEEQDNNGTTALMFACKRGQLFVVQWLLKKGADVSHRDHFGATVLHYAAMGANLNVLMFLTQRGLVNLARVKSISKGGPTEAVVDQTPLDVCKEKGNHLQYLLLWLSWQQWRAFGKVLNLNSVYPILYWFISFVNFALFFPMWSRVYSYNAGGSAFFYLWIFAYFATQLFWVINKMSNAGVSNTNQPSSVKRSTPFENVLESLHKRQQMVNFEFYCINNDLRRHFFGTTSEKYAKVNACFENEDVTKPLNNEEYENPFMPRLATCNEEMSRIFTEMRSVYPQVANERCMRNSNEYNNAVLSFEDANKICLTCCKTKSMREHHCASCNTCLIRQDHHCAWVDNCVASGNQKAFFAFLTLIGFTFLQYYQLFFRYVPIRFREGPRIYDLVVFLYVFFVNGLFLFFVANLWLRTVRSMLTDVTYYEFLKKPSHIRLKYRGNVHESFWDFKGLTYTDFAVNLFKFWTYKTRHYEAEAPNTQV